MDLRARIEQRLVLPADTETEQSQKVIGFFVASIAAVTTAFHGVSLYAAVSPEIGLLYLGQAALMAASVALLLAVPQAYRTIVVFILLIGLAFSLPPHLLGGGFTSGLWFLVWVVATPALAALFVGPRTVVVVTGLFILTVVAAAWLEPQARANLQEWPLEAAVRESSFNIVVLGVMVAATSLYLLRQVEQFRQRADSLLLNVLPAPIADRLKQSSQTIADGYADVTVLFADIVDFTTMSSGVDPVAVVSKLNELFSDFDRLAARHGLEKIKTIGDAYMVAGGLPEPRPDHCEAVMAFAIEMLEVIGQHHSWTGDPMRVRIGINRGPVVAGVIGEQKFIYDLWGDAVNVASRMESNGLANQIQVTDAVRRVLADRYVFEARPPTYIKGKGEMVTYLVQHS